MQFPPALEETALVPRRRSVSAFEDAYLDTIGAEDSTGKPAVGMFSRGTGDLRARKVTVGSPQEPLELAVG